MNPRPVPYRGRFAPTPSGPLHLGSLLTALASFLQARAAGGAWLLRIDDLDGPRCVAGADSEIQRQLEAHGLHWDEAPRYQSQHALTYRETIAQLQTQDVLYRCECTRAVIARDALPGPDGAVYPGTCRERSVSAQRAALRLRVPDALLCFDDGWQGRQCRNLAHEVGDFTVWRGDGVPGYQLVCAADEAAQGITEVVRGTDLLGSSFRQLHLLQRLGLPAPGYRHLPVLVDGGGRKLSKQNHAAPVASRDAVPNLRRCLQYLGQAPLPDLENGTVAEVLGWAAQHWRAERVPTTNCVKVE